LVVDLETLNLMFAALHSPSSPTAPDAVVGVAREFSPRIEMHTDCVVTLDVSGLRRMFGTAVELGDAIRREASARGVDLNVAIAGWRATAMIMAQARPGMTVVPDGGEAAALARVPLSIVARVFELISPRADAQDVARDTLTTLQRWGLKTCGELAALPASGLSERLGQTGMLWQRLARGEDDRPLVASQPEERFEASLDLEWPIDGLEPLSFVLGRLFDTVCDRLERRDRGAARLQVTLGLITRAEHIRHLELPTPLRDPRVLRTLALLDLESHPPPAGIDRVRIAIDPTPARVWQWSLLTRARPSAEGLATLSARLTALMGESRVGAPRLVDSHRPGAFEMANFLEAVEQKAHVTRPAPERGLDSDQRTRTLVIVRRFRLPVPARVSVSLERPVRITTDRRGLSGGMVISAAGPWRSSGSWWRPRTPVRAWDHDEWDVELTDGAAYRVSRDRELNRWFIEGTID
jgi:protein ImuB